MATERASQLIVVVLLAVFATGCLGAQTAVVADSSQYPISLSSAVRDADSTVVKGEDLERAGDFHAESTAWGMLYSTIRLTPTTDMSNAVNQELKRTGGDALVNLRIMTTQCALDWAPLLYIVPFLPGCANVVIEGDIVRVKRGPSAPKARRSTTTPSRIASASIEAQRL